MMSRSIGENLKKVILFFSNYLSLQIWTLKICNHDISKTIHNVFFALAFLPDFTPEIAVFGGKVGYPLML